MKLVDVMTTGHSDQSGGIRGGGGADAGRWIFGARPRQRWKTVRPSIARPGYRHPVSGCRRRSARPRLHRDKMSGEGDHRPAGHEVALAAGLMGRSDQTFAGKRQVWAMVSLGDLAMQDETSIDAWDALTEISNNLSSRDGRL